MISEVLGLCRREDGSTVNWARGALTYWTNKMWVWNFTLQN